MAYEYTIDIHTGTDGVIQIIVPEEWADQDVTITLKPTTTPHNPTDQTIEDLEAVFVEKIPQTPVLTLEDMSRETLYGLR